MSELPEFLAARLDDDAEEIAQHPDGEDDWASHELHAATETNYPCFSYLQIHKKRALAEVEAKRRVLDLHREVELPDEMMDACATCEVTGKHPEYPCTTLRLLALPYADHPDYDESWRP